MSENAPTPVELAVLKHLWASGPQSARETHNAVGVGMGWSPSTTRTIITRMADKGLVVKRDVHGLAVYEASAEKVSMMSQLIRDFAANVLELDGPMPATAFANSRLFTDEEAEALTQMLEDEGDAS